MSQNYDLAGAAEYLRCRPHFLESNLANLPHQRMGRAIAFDESELEEIKQMFRVRPGAQAKQTAPAGALTLASISPSKGSRKAS